MGDRFVDTASFFRVLTKQSKHATEKYIDFLDFFNNSIIYSLNQNGKLLGFKSKYYQNLSGLNIFFPKNRQELDKYTYLPVFSELKLTDIFGKTTFI